ncbi:DUF7410 domain-containing protein [Halorarum salinum]|uniref:C2H2-type zinc finger protein n=1 Tax=Halorarum salinum TaxID=2743089 RepID=A0A7D5L9X4_9EURY|nr:C2H2-type zinc finger protein [Halobaculum salinum]QLG61653.1 C2H2-type zinc finger protein [Halobaculum salinum]
MTADTRSDAVREDDAGSDAPPGLDLDVPEGATVHECPRCGAPFARERHRDLHLGLAHAELTAEERDRYVAASEDERADLRSFQIRALGAIVLLYFGFLFTYAVAA